MPLTALLLAGGAVAFFLLMPKKPKATIPVAPIQVVKASSGRQWKVSTVGPGLIDLIAPKGLFGPHNDMLVLRYQQQGSDTNARKVVNIYDQVPLQMVDAAKADFGLK